MLLTELTTDGNEILPNDVHYYKISLGSSELWKVVFYLSRNTQQFSMKYWVSYTAGGTPIGSIQNLKILSLDLNASEMYIAEMSADISSLGETGTTTIPNPSTSRGSMVLHQSGPYIIFEDSRDLYLNIHNISGKTGNYVLLANSIT